MQFPVIIELHRSRLISFFLLLFHVLAAGCVISLPWPRPLLGLLLALVALSLCYVKRPSRIVGLRLSDQSGFDCILANGNRDTLTVLAESTVFSRLIVLRLRIGEDAQLCNLVLLPDHMTAEHFRVLRLWLRWRSDAKKHP